MNTRNKAMIAGAIVLAIGIPAAFAATYDGQRLIGSVRHAMFGSGATQSGSLTYEERAAKREQMEKIRTAMENLSDADKATLKEMRKTAAKAERDFLRSKGVPLPSEDDITKLEASFPNAGMGYGMMMGSTNMGERMGNRLSERRNAGRMHRNDRFETGTGTASGTTTN